MIGCYAIFRKRIDNAKKKGLKNSLLVRLSKVQSLLAATVDQIAELKAIQDEAEANKKSMTEGNVKLVGHIKKIGKIDVELVKLYGAHHQEKFAEIQLKVDEAKAKLQSVKTSGEFDEVIEAISDELDKLFEEEGEESSTSEMEALSISNEKDDDDQFD